MVKRAANRLIETIRERRVKCKYAEFVCPEWFVYDLWALGHVNDCTIGAGSGQLYKVRSKARKELDSPDQELIQRPSDHSSKSQPQANKCRRRAHFDICSKPSPAYVLGTSLLLRLPAGVSKGAFCGLEWSI